MKYAQKVKMMALLLALILVFVTACSGGENDSKSSETSSNTAANTEGSHTPSEEPVKADPFGKYDPPITITTVRTVSDAMKFPEGDTIDNNVWTRAMDDELGIKIKNEWVVSDAQAAQKMNVSIASGDLPEFIQVTASQLKQLIDSDMIMDITDVYENYAAPFTKEVITQDGGKALQAATFDGRLMAIPSSGSMMDSAPMLWVREDWRTKLNLPEPKTMNDVFAMIEAFTNADFDGNSKKDTVGIALYKDLFGGYAGLEGFFNGYHAYPGQWIKDASGNLASGSIQPEVKTALAKLQEMYKAGLIDREFGVKDNGKAGEAQGAGKNGIHFGQMWNPLSPLSASRDNDPNAQWQAYPLPSIDGEPALPQVSLGVEYYYAVLKDTDHPEAMMKIINMFVEKGWGESTTPEIFSKFFNDGGLEHHKYPPFFAWPARNNLDIHLRISDAIDKKDPSKLGAQEKAMYDQVTTYIDGKGSSSDWAYDRVFGKTGAFSVINKYVDENLLKLNEYFAAPTPTTVEKGASLNKMQQEVYTRIIMGSPISDFDKFVADYKKLGGDQITKEVNEWYQSQ